MRVLDVFLTIIHVVVIIFNLFGWIIPRLRRAHFILVSFTWFSWIFLGIWFGVGYCPITDWQWQVKEKLGEKNLPPSFITYALEKSTGQNLSDSVVEMWTGIAFILVTIISFYFRFIRKKT